MAYQGDSIFWVDVDKIKPNPYQPRREFDEAKLRELAESIRMYGILQPLVVTRREIEREDGGLSTEYELIAGERRLRASKISGLMQVPVIIREGDPSEEHERVKLELAIIENLQREDLNPIDRALAFQQLASEFSLSQTQVAKKVGRSRVYVANTMRLLQLPEEVLNSMRNGEITEGHGRTLLMLNDRPEEQHTLFREILLKKLSVREVERISRKIATDKVRKKGWDTDPGLIMLEQEFTETLGTRVQIEKKEFGGKLVIDYFSDDDLHRILEMAKQHPMHIDAEMHVKETATPASSENPAEENQEHLAEAQEEPLSPLVQKVENTTSITHSEDTEEQEGDVPPSSPLTTSQELQEEAEPEDDRSKEEIADTDNNDDDLYGIKNFSV